tara:strand:+ start:308 stop:1249 length:942 start_codon:yes stop_codon:yes gene_type:complete
MVDLKYNKHTQVINFSNSYNYDIKLNVWVKDLGTNLYAHNFWINLMGNTHNVEYDFYNNFPCTPSNSPGVVIEAYHYDDINKCEVEEKIIWGDINTSPKFTVPKQSIFGHWLNLMAKPTLPITEEDVVYDLGAHYGTFTMWAKNAKQVYSFEPTPSIIPYLNSTFRDMRNIKIFEKAIGPKNTTQQFRINETHHSSNTLWDHMGGNTTPQMLVNVVNLEDFIAKNNLLSPTFLKVDIEGAEWEFIDSLSDSFFDTINKINLEFHMISYENLGKMLLKFMRLGFKLELQEEVCYQRMMGTINLFKENHTYNKLT